MNKSENREKGLIATNRRALRNFTVIESVEAGIVLRGTEVKSARQGGMNISAAYADVQDRDVWLVQASIPPYDCGNRFNHDPKRPRRLLLHRREILRLRSLIEQKGLTLVPLKVYLKRGRLKLDLALCKGKSEYDKRHSIRQRDDDREAQRAVARHWRG